jgi:hypothetical protein
MSTTAEMSLADRAAHGLASYVRHSCSARTARGMRTPTGDYMTCTGGHSAGDLHGAPFGKSGWFSWTDEPSAAKAVS